MTLHISLREDLDKGTPTVISRPESKLPLSTASWLTALQLSSTGRVKSSGAMSSARSNAY
ncbi:hypothetical protein ACLK11_12180 [Escherichia coli]